MTTVEIDFDLFKTLTNLRATEEETLSDVIRKALRGSETGARVVYKGADGPAQIVWGATFDGVLFPNGTLFQANYKGRTYRASIHNGVWQDENGVARKSPSHAACAISGTNVNGWRFWKAKRPEDQTFQLMDRLRPR